MDVTFPCPACDRPARQTLPADWECPACGHRLSLAAADPATAGCAVCGNRELYRKKDFPHWLGLTILTAACVASVITYGLYEKWLTWAILLGSAAFDGLLYLWVGDAVVCYRCNAHHRGLRETDRYLPHDLSVSERYRQERLRRDLRRQEKVVERGE